MRESEEINIVVKRASLAKKENLWSVFVSSKTRNESLNNVCYKATSLLALFTTNNIPFNRIIFNEK